MSYLIVATILSVVSLGLQAFFVRSTHKNLSSIAASTEKIASARGVIC